MNDGNLRGQLPIPYPTNNGALAIVLNICGVPFLKHEGIDYPGFNLYSTPFLAEKGYAGKKASVAIKELFDKGIPGQIVYQFERVTGSPLIEEITTAWDNMAESIERADSGHPDASTATSTPVDCAMVAAICCQFVKMRKVFYGDRGLTPLWRRRDAKGNLFIPACRAAEGASRTERDGERTIIYGSMKLQSVKV